MTATLDFPARRSSLPLLAFVGIVGLLALAGGALALGSITAGTEDADHEHAVAIGEPIATSYGSITVLRVERLGGLTSQDLGGVTHGIQNLVLSDKAQVEVAVLIANTGDAQVRVEPSQFRLIVDGAPDPAVPTGSTMQPLSLQPGASVEASISFVLPQSGATMAMGYRDPGNAAAITVPIGNLDRAPAVPDDGHSH